MPRGKYALFLGGPIGAGKTVLGRALAVALAGGFIDGDDHGDPTKPWHASTLRTSRGVMAEVRRLSLTHDHVVIAYPLRCTTWIYYRRRTRESGLTPVFVTLRASFDAIVAPQRGRTFSQGERDRIRVMLAEGYADRPFSDLIFDTDRLPLAESVDALVRAVGPFLRAA